MRLYIQSPQYRDQQGPWIPIGLTMMASPGVAFTLMVFIMRDLHQHFDFKIFNDIEVLR